jgi:hypothetical protein
LGYPRALLVRSSAPVQSAKDTLVAWPATTPMPQPARRCGRSHRVSVSVAEPTATTGAKNPPRPRLVPRAPIRRWLTG